MHISFFPTTTEYHPFQELLPISTALILDPFASHVLRALILLLSPSLASSSSQSQPSNLRSKKSAAFKARQGPMKSVFTQQSREPTLRSTPDEFMAAAGKFVTVLRDELSANEVRALAADKIASPVLQVCTSTDGSNSLKLNTKYRCYWR